MRRVCCLLAYVVVVFAGGALLAPWLYHLAQWSAGHWHGLDSLAANPFYRYVQRAILGLALAGLWPLLRSCGMLSPRSLGLCGGRPLAGLLVGFSAGFVSLACVAVLAAAFGGRSPDFSHSGSEFAGVLIGATVAAIVVAILEELIFRGALYGILRSTFPWPAALAASSAVYAAAHFLQKAPAPVRIDWLSGLVLLTKMLQTHPDGLALVPAIFTLFVAGAILALAYQRTGSLYMSMGLHAGWIFWLRAYRLLTRDAPGGTALIWGSDKLLDGWLPLAALICVFVVLTRWKPRAATRAAPGGTDG